MSLEDPLDKCRELTIFLQTFCGISHRTKCSEHRRCQKDSSGIALNTLEYSKRVFEPGDIHAIGNLPHVLPEAQGGLCPLSPSTPSFPFQVMVFIFLILSFLPALRILLVSLAPASVLLSNNGEDNNGTLEFQSRNCLLPYLVDGETKAQRDHMLSHSRTTAF